MSGDRREADRERSRELGNRCLTHGESFDDAPAGGVGERTEEQIEIFASQFRQVI
jgi:hypothetical protein